MATAINSPEMQRQRDAERAEQRLVSAEQSKLDTEYVMSDARGRRFVAALLADARIFQPSMAADGLTLAFNEGGRNQGLRLLARLTADTPALYLQMEKERVNG